MSCSHRSTTSRRLHPSAARGLEERYDWAADVDVTTRVADLVERINEAVRSETIDRAFGRLPTFLVTGVLMLFLLAFGRRYVLGMLGLFDDLERRRVVRRVLFLGARRGRTYILFTLAHSLINGLIFGIACWLLDLPAPVSLGFAVAVMTAIPLIGTIIGGVPALLLAFGSSTWPVGVTVLALLVTLQAVEVLVVRPFVDSRSVRVGTTVALVVALVAFDLYGVGAAACAVALAAIGLAALDVYGASRDEEFAVSNPSPSLAGGEASAPHRSRRCRRVRRCDRMCQRWTHFSAGRSTVRIDRFDVAIGGIDGIGRGFRCADADGHRAGDRQHVST